MFVLRFSKIKFRQFHLIIIFNIILIFMVGWGCCYPWGRWIGWWYVQNNSWALFSCKNSRLLVLCKFVRRKTFHIKVKIYIFKLLMLYPQFFLRKKDNNMHSRTPQKDNSYIRKLADTISKIIKGIFLMQIFYIFCYTLAYLS